MISASENVCILIYSYRNGVKEGHPVVTDQSESLSVAMDTVDTVTDTEFDQLCTRLNLPDDVKKKSWSVYTQMKCKDDEELKVC